MTWETGGGEKACEHCGAVHTFTYRDYPARDRGEQDCLSCGKELMSWKGTRDYFDFALKPKPRKAKK